MLLRIHGALHLSPWLRRFTVVTRLSIAFGFIPSGFKKVIGERFTTLGIDSPVGFFFEAFYGNQVWYRTVGWAQLIAAVLLIFPSTAHLGALLFLPIILNIWLVTVGVGFQGTWVLTTLMLLANLWLVAWEYDRLRPLFAMPQSALRRNERTMPWSTAFGVLGAAGYAGLYALDIALVRSTIGPIGFAIAAAAGAGFGVVAAWHVRGIR